jgi:endoglucanase
VKTDDVLMKLSDSFGPSGYEDEVLNLIEESIKNDVDEIIRDSLKNLIALKRGNGKKKIAIFTHMDEIAFLISSIDERGFARVETIGGVDPKVIISQKVIIKSRDGKIRKGIFGMLAPHLQNNETRKKIPDYSSLFLDVSMNADWKNIEVGDLVGVDTKAIKLADLVCGKAMDNRACVLVNMLLAKELNKYSSYPDVYHVFNTQEEVGLIGATVSSHRINPDLAIVMDVTFHDPETDVKIGGGPAISVGGPNVDKNYYKKLTEYASDNDFKFQYEVANGRSGSDADAVQLARKGIPTLLLSIPIKYMHTPVEIVGVKDIDNTAKLLAGFLYSLTEEGEN